MFCSSPLHPTSSLNHKAAKTAPIPANPARTSTPSCTAPAVMTGGLVVVGVYVTLGGAFDGGVVVMVSVVTGGGGGGFVEAEAGGGMTLRLMVAPH